MAARMLPGTCRPPASLQIKTNYFRLKANADILLRHIDGFQQDHGEA